MIKITIDLNIDMNFLKIPIILVLLLSMTIAGDIFNEATEAPVKDYKLPFISIVLFLAYGISFVLAKKKKIKLITHRRIWNVLLLFAFLATGLTGLLLILKISHGIIIQLPGNMLFLHVETGIVMAIISIFHILWHFDYYKRIFIKK